MRLHKRPRPAIAGFNTVLSVLEKCSEWQRALDIFGSMIHASDGGLWPRADSFTYSAGLAACTMGANWLLALSVFDSMPCATKVSNIACYNAVLAAAAGANAWRTALALLADMHAHGLPSGEISLKTVLFAFRVGPLT
eukprot:gnl/MRDRNA2_/MRDRNA2_376649_c0_seq1.p1 gnl/MRDRNA2_/MRDRNA2_376649_c0~~gnl/MRDRNA2_/MRDRNA2_376649_c0_seq1.p1  ORF type:complete len:138 (+),score=13.57 gnl/MRDRNA2_/MRDRNA2_376649_c0_seq1:268-681(+)